MTAVTVTAGLRHAARLIPFRTRSASNLAGEYGTVSRYWVTSYGVPIAWVTLDGRTHYADLPAPLLPGTDSDAGIVSRHRAMIRHRDAIRASWPERFAMNSEGDPERSLFGTVASAIY